ncbi:uncharacterized protein LOC9630308 isoform X2 [Selaginella moellendorffii]|uniref:uncharacterized protein LOC9630308 isoform X2 n=1 Tax=Selaginella moellendorffii TaxID=88036 RepID=UPI000D1CE168|nr:uncharacterized protein LOC9630308 isoform X2 [Selaginella moellendorffii]|eukprot:XP_024518720.1 uncharacterized protein LOC9630308 isoform X2 [Selaginella moellendorffii]
MPSFATYNPYGQPGPPPGHFGAKAFQMAQSGPAASADVQQADSPSKSKPVKNGSFGHSSGSDGSSEGSEDDNSNNNNNVRNVLASFVNTALQVLCCRRMLSIKWLWKFWRVAIQQECLEAALAPLKRIQREYRIL